MRIGAITSELRCAYFVAATKVRIVPRYTLQLMYLGAQQMNLQQCKTLNFCEHFDRGDATLAASELHRVLGDTKY
jgi:hypothetical protein